MDADGDVDLYDFYLYQPNTCPEFCTTIANQPPYPPQYDRIPVCVKEAVVCNTQDVTSSTSAKSIHIQDPGGLPGVTIYGTNAEFAVTNPVALDNLQLGDVIEIQAHGMNFFGTNELVTDYDDFEVTLLSTGNPAPTPTVLTIAQFSDDYLSTLITVQDVSFTDAGGTFVVETNYEITEAGSGATTDVRISGDTNGWIGQTIPSGQRDVIGILGQYNGVYQIKVRYYPDDIPAHVP